jgi:uracil-DNA glycosylase
MWDSINKFGDDLDPNIEIPKGFDIYSLIMPKEEITKEIENGIEKLEVSSLFDKYLPDNDWYPFLQEEIGKEYFKNIEEKVKKSFENGLIYPEKKNIFRAFELTPLKNIKVIIIGQDPYPGVCKKTNIPYANGLAFSVNKECSIPASLRNMYKEMERCGLTIPNTGELEKWAKQGVFLLNTQLTVVKGKPNSHKFWQKFTDNIIKYLGTLDKKLVYVLMGGNALSKYKYISKNNARFVITSHPSPLSYKKKLKSYPAFYGSNIFLDINENLRKLKLKEIKW